MANQKHLQIIQQGVEAWNQWRDQHGDIRVDLGGADLHGADLGGVNLRRAILRKATLSGATLSRADLSRADLSRADLSRAILGQAYLSEADLSGANLSGADLDAANLSGANLSGANLTDADLGEAYLGKAILNGADLSRAALPLARLSEANLTKADLTKANLTDAILREANLTDARLFAANLDGTNLNGATLSRADLVRADLRHTDMSEADVSEVALRDTVFGNTNLTAVRGLEICRHDGPSTLDNRTLTKSGPLPLAFLRGCGLNDWEIEATKLYQPSLTPTEINDIVYRIYDLRADPLFQFYSCFISYASRDHAFVERLYEDLQNNGVRCWCAHEDMKIGDRIRDTIEQQIRLRQKLLIVLSSASIASTWVEYEVEAALEEERMSPERRTVLVPITIDHTVEETNLAWARTIKRMRHIGDFTCWDDKDAYQKALARLLRNLNIVERKLGG